MTSGSFGFDRFLLDTRDRQLRRDGAPVDLGSRYLDALVLLVSEAGRLIPKDRFLDEVWRGVPVTDEALTQCIKTLRKQLGDDAGRPRFIETVPKHGYRFIAPVEALGDQPPLGESSTARRRSWRDVLLLGAAGTVGGGVAGFCGGLAYGFLAASQPLPAGSGAISVLLVILCLTIAMAAIGAAGVSLGIATAERFAFGSGTASIAGGALGGLVVGACVRLLGIDAFNLIFGHAPAGITGALEGLVLGGAVGIGTWQASRGGRSPTLRRAVAVAAAVGAAGGVTIILLGGRMMAGSLDLLARTFPDSRLRLDQAGAMFGEHGLGPVTQIFTGAVEGALFSACIVGEMVIAQRSLNEAA